MNDIAMISDTFNIIITILIGALCAVTIIQPFVLTKTARAIAKPEKDY